MSIVLPVSASGPSSAEAIVGQPGTIIQLSYGQTTPDSTPTLAIARDDGLVLEPTVTVAQISPTVFQATLDATAVATVERLALTWSTTVGGQLFTVTTRVDISGGYYFDTADLAALPDIAQSPTLYTATLQLRARRYVERLIDRTCQTSFVRRYKRDVLSGADAGDDGSVHLRDPYAKQILTATVNGTDLTSTQLGQLTLLPNGILVPAPAVAYLFTTPGLGAQVQGNIAVRYAAGYRDTCPEDLSNAALKAARAWLLAQYGASGTPDRALSITNEFGNVRLATPGTQYPTGIPDVDAVIMSYAQDAHVPAIA